MQIWTLYNKFQEEHCLYKVKGAVNNDLTCVESQAGHILKTCEIVNEIHRNLHFSFKFWWKNNFFLFNIKPI